MGGEKKKNTKKNVYTFMYKLTCVRLQNEIVSNVQILLLKLPYNANWDGPIRVYEYNIRNLDGIEKNRKNNTFICTGG